MKKIQFAAKAVALAVGVAVIAISCGDNKSKKFGDISFETFDFSTYAVGADADSMKRVDENYSGLWSVKAEGVLPVKADDYDMTALRDTLCTLAGIKISDDKISSKLPDYLRTAPEKVDSAEVRSMLMRRVSLELMTPQIMVFEVYSYQYPEGAAHGGYANRYVNFSLLSGKILTMDEIFVAGYQEKLEKMIRDKVADMPDLIVEENDVKIPANYRFTNEGITFVYSIYEIAPYSSGEPQVDFNYAELKDILKPEIQQLFY